MAAAWESISLLMICLVFGSLYVAKMIEDERLELLKAFFFLYGMLNIFISGLLFLPIQSADTPAGLNTFALAFASINALLLVFVVWFYGVYLFERFFDKTKKVVEKGGGL